MDVYSKLTWHDETSSFIRFHFFPPPLSSLFVHAPVCCGCFVKWRFLPAELKTLKMTQCQHKLCVGSDSSWKIIIMFCSLRRNRCNDTVGSQFNTLLFLDNGFPFGTFFFFFFCEERLKLQYCFQKFSFLLLTSNKKKCFTYLVLRIISNEFTYRKI